MNTKKDNAIPYEPLTEHCSFAETYEKWMSHCLRLAKNPGWKEHIWWTVKDLDSDKSGLFTGFKDDFLRRIHDDDSIRNPSSPSPKGQTQTEPIRNLHPKKDKNL